MVNTKKQIAQPQALRYGLTLSEVLVASVIAGAIIVSALNSLASSQRGVGQISEKGQALLLAQDMMAEILRQSYSDPDGSIVIGIDDGENKLNRTTFDDVDDYHLWSSSPPTYPDGMALSHSTKWTRTVEVVPTTKDDLSKTLRRTVDRGVKRITVKIIVEEQTVAELTSYFSRAWTPLIPTPNNGTAIESPLESNQPPILLTDSVSPTSGTSPLLVNFDVSNTYDASNLPLSFAWDFGDGTAGSGSNVSHLFSGSEQWFCVTLVISDDQGATTTKHYWIYVR